VSDYRDWQNNKFANPNGYYNDYTNNPYFLADNSRRDSKNNFFNGNLNLELKATDWLTVNYRIGTAVTNTFTKDFVGKFLYTAYAKATAKTFEPQYNDYNGINRAKTDALGSVADLATNGTRINSDFYINLNKTFKKFSTKLILGNNIQQRQSYDNRLASTSILIPGVYSVTNRAGDLDQATANAYGQTTSLRKYGFYGDLTLGYNDMFFLHGSGRNDNTSLFYTSTRDKSLYSYFYYGIDASAVITNAVPSLKSNVLSFLKLRLSYNTNKNDNLNPYDLTLTYSSAAGFPYGNTVGTVSSTTLPDPNLKPETVSTYEAGFELGLFKSKVNVDFSIYKQKSEDVIISTGVSNATGFSNYRVNAASLDNTGIELDVKANIISRKNFNWEVNANYTYNNNKVISIFRDLPRFLSGSIGTAGFLFAELDNPFPYLKTTGYRRDGSGNVVIDKSNGWPIKSVDQVNQGNTLPKNTFGFGTKLTYKGFSFSANLEMRTGYKVYQGLAGSLAVYGQGYNTGAAYDRKPFLYPNSVYDDGTGKLITNTNVLVRSDYAWYYGYGDAGTPTSYGAIGETNVTSGFFLKIRDVAISYAIPSALLAKTKVFKGASFTVFGRNLYTWVAKDNIYTDPEFNAFATSNNATGISTAANNTPPVRSIGATLSLTF
ncbi:MAG: TonB-dependent receptor, partial [Deinococcales bacterium]|nr:TonB-dependent receptor [Chitinophagaceae bacterium]